MERFKEHFQCQRERNLRRASIVLCVKTADVGHNILIYGKAGTRQSTLINYNCEGESILLENVFKTFFSE